MRPVQHEQLQLRHGTASFPIFPIFFSRFISTSISSPLPIRGLFPLGCSLAAQRDPSLASKWRTTKATRSKHYAHRMAGRSHRSRWNQWDYHGTTAHTTVHCNDNDYTHSGVFLCGEGLGMKSGMCFAGTRRRVHLFAVHVDINFNANHVSSEHWQPLPHEVEYHRGCGGHRQNRRIARVNSHQWSTAPPYADVKREASAARVENSYAHRQTPVPWSLLKGHLSAKIRNVRRCR